MQPKGVKRIVLMADDDRDDIWLTKEALAEVAPEVELRELYDGQQLVDYLSCIAEQCSIDSTACRPPPELHGIYREASGTECCRRRRNKGEAAECFRSFS